jgi:hypothetical protein
MTSLRNVAWSTQWGQGMRLGLSSPPEVLSLVPGVNMETEAQDGFYGPTNKENAVGGTRSNFLTKEEIVRPPFVNKGQGKKKNDMS